MDGWINDSILRPFQQYFSHISTMVGYNERLCAMEPRLSLERFSPLAELEVETANIEINFELTYLTSSVDDADGASVAGVVELKR